MITIKLPYSTSKSNLTLIQNMQRQQSAMFRYSYCRVKEGYKEKEIRLLSKRLNNIDLLDSWFIQCSIKEAIQQVESEKSLSIEKSLFGGKHNFFKRLRGQITKEDWKSYRLRPIVVQGESPSKGNRKFELNVVENNTIIFKPKRGIKIELQLPKLRANYRSRLFWLQQLAESKQIPYTVKLDQQYVFISFEENKTKIKYKTSGNYIGIDLNPNYIACTLFNKDKQLLKSCTFDLTILTKQFKQNKILFESYEIAKKITDFCIQNKVDFIFVENLKNLKPGENNKGKRFNRLVNNSWPKSRFISNLKKRARAVGISLFEINPAYSSYIGNINNPNNLPDPISASAEIARRGYSLIIEKTKQFYPNFDKTELLSQWKDLVEKHDCQDWLELVSLIKNLKMKYRVPWSLDYGFRKFVSRRSKIGYNKYIYSLEI